MRRWLIDIDTEEMLGEGIISIFLAPTRYETRLTIVFSRTRLSSLTHESFAFPLIF
jgi:hypothetical protein